MASDASDKIIVQCTCGAKLRVSANAVGKKAKCPKCGGVVAITAPEPLDPVADQANAPDGLLEGLAAHEDSAQAQATPAPTTGTTSCPQCQAALPHGAVLCVQCGYNVETGRKRKAADAPPSVGARVAKAAGTFLLGCVLSCVGALVGAGVWCAVTIITEYEIGWIAWGLGVLAGTGMYLGYRQKNMRAGAVAGCVSVAGIFAAKMMLVAYFVLPMIKVTSGDERVQRLANHHGGLAAQEQGLSFTHELRLTLIEEQRDRYAGSSDEELDAAIAEMETWEAGEKYSDSVYVTHSLAYALVYSAADESIKADPDASGIWNLGPEEWDRFYQEATDQVARMQPDERVAELKRFHGKRESEQKRFELAQIFSNRKAIEMGLSYGNEKRERLLNEEKGKLGDSTVEELEAALAKDAAWQEEGRWQDAEYVRSFLIYSEIDKVLEKRSEEAESDEERGAIWETAPEDWEQLWADGGAHVDARNPGELADEAKRIYAERQRSNAEALAAFLDYQESSRASKFLSNSSVWFSAIVEEMMNPFDALFLFLAVASAYGIASGSRGGGD